MIAICSQNGATEFAPSTKLSRQSGVKNDFFLPNLLQEISIIKTNSFIQKVSNRAKRYPIRQFLERLRNVIPGGTTEYAPHTKFSGQSGVKNDFFLPNLLGEVSIIKTNSFIQKVSNWTKRYPIRQFLEQLRNVIPGGATEYAPHTKFSG